MGTTVIKEMIVQGNYFTKYDAFLKNYFKMQILFVKKLCSKKCCFLGNWFTITDVTFNIIYVIS